MPFIDAHCHLSDLRFKDTLDAVLADCATKGLRNFVMAGVDQQDWLRQIQIKTRFPHTVATVFGLHPWTVARLSKDDCDQQVAALRELIEGPERPAALGEIGLDFSHGSLRKEKEKQMLFFRQQWDLAMLYHLPVIMHAVKGHEAILQVIETLTPSRHHGILLHGFVGDVGLIKRYCALDAVLSLGPHSVHKMTKVALAAIPDTMIALESDAPNGAEGATPTAVFAVANLVAKARGRAPQDILALSMTNVQRVLELT